MKEKIIKLIKDYKSKITTLQKAQQQYEKTGRGGACITIQGSIQTYNAVIKDLMFIIQ